ncbi:hypothetical protein ABT56_11115 [Photobacterium aquae]|uniref:Uncharacterized protein n=1 Tax=Photobacterium aquae TaxID=1195763 RepID=A0A0J1H135_9GAMM|nr:hypothetical protein [Photobacterium aquae]KLV05514.1 hypothetical protein ABT56_11115 [Photobacterium aquae]
MMVSFSGINKYCDAIENININRKSPHRLFIEYHTCEQTTRTGSPINNYAFLLFQGAISPFNHDPLCIFHAISASVTGYRTYIESDIDFSRGTFTLALTQYSEFEQDISCYIVFCEGEIIEKQFCDLEILKITTNENNYHFRIRYNALPHTPNNEVNHAIIIYDVTGRSRQLGMKVIPPHREEQYQTLTVENIQYGSQLTIGYYRDPLFNTCTAKHRIIME